MVKKIRSFRDRVRVRGFEQVLERIYDQAQSQLQASQPDVERSVDSSSASDEIISVISQSSATGSSSQLTTHSNGNVTSLSASLMSSISSVPDQETYQDTTQLESELSITDLAERRDEIYGLALLISKVFTCCNLNETAQRKLYELTRIVARIQKPMVNYRDFKNILNSLVTITTYKFFYCFVGQTIIEMPPRSRCCSGDHGEIVVFSLFDTLKNIVENNYTYFTNLAIRETVEFKATRLYKEIWQDISENDESIKITLLINMDDAQMIKSTKTCTTPVPFTVAELPNHTRISKMNIHNLGLYHGPKACPVDILWDKVLIEPMKALGILMLNSRQEIVYTIDPLIIDTRYGQVKILVRAGAIIMDSVAKAKNLNIKSFMGYHSCPYCMIEGRRIVNEETRSVVFVFPYETESFDPAKTQQFYSEAANQAEASGQPYYGVKGKNSISNIVKVPDNIPIDYMHNILEGIFKFLFSLPPLKNKRISQTLDRNVGTIKLPHDSSRRFRKISEMSYWKASECRTFLFYLVPLLRGLTDDDTLLLVHSLSTITRIYSTPISKMNRSKFEEGCSLIDHFLASFQEIHGINRMRFNLHLLRHIPKQYAYMGSLIDVSAFAFENNVFCLKRSFHGTRGHCEQMARKYVIDKGLNSYKSEFHHWVSYFDSDKKLDLEDSQCTKFQFQPIGREDLEYEFDKNLLRNYGLQREQNVIKVYHQFRVRHVVYNSINYRYNRNSCSWAVVCKNSARTICYGQILCFLVVESRTFPIKTYALINEYKKNERPYFVKNLQPVDQNLKKACSLSYINDIFVLISLTTRNRLIDCQDIASKLVLVPALDHPNKFWCSEMDIPFDHD